MARERRVSRAQLKAKAASATAAAAGQRDPAFRNRQRTLVVSSRGCTHRDRHVMEDLRFIMPHAKEDSKVDLDNKEGLAVLNEIAELKSANNAVFIEARKNATYLWVGKTPGGPSAKFLMTNVHTMDELKLTGNCLKGSRFFLTFDHAFEEHAHLSLIKELFTQALGVPKGHLRSKPFIDHAMSFFYLDKRIWVRHYQIVDKRDDPTHPDDTLLVEIGPRFVLQPVRIFSGSFGGKTLYQNKEFRTPVSIRRALKAAKAEVAKDKKRSRDMYDKTTLQNIKYLPDSSLAGFFEDRQDDDDGLMGVVERGSEEEEEDEDEDDEDDDEEDEEDEEDDE